MELLLLILLVIFLGILIYIIIKHRVTGITRKQFWMLWSVIMSPAFSLGAWVVLYGKDEQLPLVLIISTFVIFLFLYWFLLQWGQVKSQEKPKQPSGDVSTDDQTESKTSELKLRPITPNEEKQLRNCFPWGIYYLQNLDYRPQAILCRGKLRANPELAYNTIQSKVTEKFGDRFFVIFQEGAKDQPFFALVPNPHSQTQNPDQQFSEKPGLALGLLAISFFVTTISGIDIAVVSWDKLQIDLSLLQKGLSYSLALVGILLLREGSHYLMTRYYQIRSTLPYFIPLPFFPGTLGGLIQKRSPIPNRQALFDIAIIGPAVGLIASISILAWGISISEVVDLSEESRLLSIDNLNPRFSFLLAILSKIALGTQLGQETAINLHPIAVAGYVALGLTTLNLMPIGQLDGGQIAHAVFGQRTAAGIGQITRILMLILAWKQPDFLIIAIVTIFMPVFDEPALNDVSQLNNWRDLGGLLALAMVVIILLPLPATVAQWLNL